MQHTSIGIAWWWVTILALALGLIFVSVIAQAHDQVIIQCSKNIPIKEVFLVGSSRLENGLISEVYSKTKGGDPYIEALSVETAQYPGQDHDPFPLFYLVDTDGDQNPDITYEDTAWDEPDLSKHCDKIIEVDRQAWNKRKEM